MLFALFFVMADGICLIFVMADVFVIVMCGRWHHIVPYVCGRCYDHIGIG